MPNSRRLAFARTLALIAGAAVLAAPLSASTPAQAQTSPRAGSTERSPDQLLADFIHYVKIDQRELAESYGRALLELGLDADQFLALVEDTPQAQVRFDEAVRDALRDARLQPIAAELDRLLKSGELGRARDPNAVTRNIELLSGPLRARTLARQRLMEAGQYAVPQLLAAMTNPNDSVTALEARRLLRDLGADAVAPLTAALPLLGPAAQEQVVIVLGEIGHSEAAPFLAELARSQASVPGVRSAATQALARVAPGSEGLTNAELYLALAERYYAEPRELTRFDGEEHQLVWVYEPAVGLFPTPVRTEVFHEAMAMRLAERALQSDANVAGAVPLWLSSNFSRHIDTPQDYDNPLYGAERRDAMYYAVAAGADATQAVLARALQSQDTALGLLAIEALARTAGGAALWSGTPGDKPLLEALGYPDRRVQFAAAMVLGNARPGETFPGADRIVPILASAVRDAGDRFAIVLGRSIEAEQRLTDMLQARGYLVIGRGSSLNEVRSAVADAPGIDLIVVDQARGATEDTLRDARADAKLRVAPVLAILPYEDFSALSATTYGASPLVRFLRQGVSDDQITESIDDLLANAGWGDEGAQDINSRAMGALGVLRDIAGGRSALSVGDATAPLLSALDTSSGGVRLFVADVLSRIAERRAQIGLMEAAFDAEGDERLALMTFTADSAKRFGPMLDERHVRQLLEIASDGPDDEATAAASLLGALNLPGQRIVPLLLGAE